MTGEEADSDAVAEGLCDCRINVCEEGGDLLVSASAKLLGGSASGKFPEGFGEGFGRERGGWIRGVIRRERGFPARGIVEGDRRWGVHRVCGPPFVNGVMSSQTWRGENFASTREVGGARGCLCSGYHLIHFAPEKGVDALRGPGRDRVGSRIRRRGRGRGGEKVPMQAALHKEFVTSPGGSASHGRDVATLEALTELESCLALGPGGWFPHSTGARTLLQELGENKGESKDPFNCCGVPGLLLRCPWSELRGQRRRRRLPPTRPGHAGSLPHKWGAVFENGVTRLAEFV